METVFHSQGTSLVTRNVDQTHQITNEVIPISGYTNPSIQPPSHQSQDTNSLVLATGMANLTLEPPSQEDSNSKGNIPTKKEPSTNNESRERVALQLIKGVIEAFERQAIPQAPFGKEKDLLPNTKDFIEPKNMTSNQTEQEEQAPIEFKQSVFDWEPALKNLRKKVSPSFYQLRQRDDEFYNDTLIFLDSSVERDKKELENENPAEHYWFTEKTRNSCEMKPEFIPVNQQEYISNFDLIEKTRKKSKIFNNSMVIDLDKPEISYSFAQKTFETISSTISDKFNFNSLTSGIGYSSFMIYHTDAIDSSPMLRIIANTGNARLKEVSDLLECMDEKNAYLIKMEGFHFTKEDFPIFSRFFRIGALNSPLIWFADCLFDLGRMDLYYWNYLKKFHTSLVFEHCLMHEFTKDNFKIHGGRNDTLVLFHRTAEIAPDAIEEGALIENQ